MRVRLLLFARAKELVGTGETELELAEGSTADALEQAILAAHPCLRELEGSFVLALNQSYLDDKSRSAILSSGDEVAVIPPISGG